MVVKSGRFGDYVTDGEYNATLRKDDTVEAITLERAAELLAERRAKGPAKKTAKKGAKKTHREEDGREEDHEEAREEVRCPSAESCAATGRDHPRVEDGRLCDRLETSHGFAGSAGARSTGRASPASSFLARRRPHPHQNDVAMIA